VLGLLWYRATVAVTDWFDACYVPQAAGRFGLEDNIHYVLTMIQSLGSNPHVVGVCQGAVPALAATALLSAKEPEMAPCSLTLVAAPIDPLDNPTGVVRLARSHPLDWFAENAIGAVPVDHPGEGRLVYPKALQLRTLMTYIGRHTTEGHELFWKLMNDDGEDAIQFPFWSLASSLMDLPAEFFLENLGNVFHNQDLRRDRLQVGGMRVDLRAIERTALMKLEGEEDDIVGPRQTQAAHALCPAIPSSKHEHVAVPRSGHFSLFHGAICRSRVVPEIKQFMMRVEQSWPRAFPTQTNSYPELTM
jgi:poly(3-hydroxybutyrate) depolymerase